MINKKTFVIQDIINHGFWSEAFRDFKGYIFATHYEKYDYAESVANEIIKPVTILTIYS
jgi:hypothetical protein